MLKVTEAIKQFILELSADGKKSIEIARKVTDKFGILISDRTVRSVIFNSRIELTEDTKENSESKAAEAEKKQGKDEWKPSVIMRKDGFYEITNGKDRIVVISKDKLARFKDLYCGDKHLSMNEVSRNLDIPRRDLYMIKTAFDITHDDTPFLDEELDGDIDELVDISLEKKKELFFLKLQQKEISDLKREVDKFREKDHFYNKVIEGVVIPERPLMFRPAIINSANEAQINFADWHTGLKTESYWNVYSLAIQKERLIQFVSECKEIIFRYNIRKLHIMNLGDLLHGLIHTSTRIVAEVDVISQLRITWQLLADIIEEFARHVEEVYFYSTYGNHSRLTERKEDALDRENLEYLIPDFLMAALKGIPNIKFSLNEYDEQIIVGVIADHLIYGVHGDRDKPAKVAQDLTMMLEKKPYKIFTAHTHHKEVLEVHKVGVIVSRSLCGVEEYSKDIRCTSEAGQSIYVYSPKRLEGSFDITF